MTNNIIFSKPVSFPRSFQVPQNFYCCADEAKLSWEFAKILPITQSDRFVRVFLALKLLKERRYSDLIITGRYGEYFALLQGLFRWGKKKHLLLDVEWYGTRSNKILNDLPAKAGRLLGA